MSDTAVLYRPHGGSLADAMAEVISVKSRAELVSFLKEKWWHFFVEVKDEDLHIEPYTYDSRIGWDTYIVTLDGYGVQGYTNGPLS